MKALNKTGAVLIEGRGLCCSPLLWVCLKCCTFDLSLPKLLVLQGRGRLLKRWRLLCVLALQSGGVFMYISQKAVLSWLLIISRCGFKCVDSEGVYIRVMSTQQHILFIFIAGSVLSHTSAFDYYKYAYYLFCNTPLPVGRHVLHWIIKKYTTSTDGVLKFPFEVPHVAATTCKCKLLVNDIVGRRDRLHKAEL